MKKLESNDIELSEQIKRHQFAQPIKDQQIKFRAWNSFWNKWENIDECASFSCIDEPNMLNVSPGVILAPFTGMFAELQSIYEYDIILYKNQEYKVSRKESGLYIIENLSGRKFELYKILDDCKIVGSILERKIRV